jgi:tetratricopeptide (TPR) repeat protein
MDLSLELNSRGVAFHAAGKREEALTMFRGAASVLLYTIGGTSTREETNAMGNDDRVKLATERLSQFDPDCCNDGDIMADGTAPNEKILLRHGKLEACAFIFTKALEINVHEESILQLNSNAAHDLLSAICLYNMGLTHHLMSLEASSDARSARVEREQARALYSLAFQVMERNMYVLSAEHTISQVKMAILNNLGFLHHETGEYDISRAYLDRLARFIMSLAPDADRCHGRERDDFMLNTIILWEPPAAASA